MMILTTYFKVLNNNYQKLFRVLLTLTIYLDIIEIGEVHHIHKIFLQHGFLQTLLLLYYSLQLPIALLEVIHN